MTRNLLVALFAFALMMSGCAGPETGPEVVESELTVSGGIARQDVYIETSVGRVHVELVFRPLSLVQTHRRLIVMIPGTLANGAGYYDIAPGSGYNAAEILARAGRHIVALVDLPGTGESDRPADGRDTGVEIAAAAVREAAQHLRLHLLILSRVDLYGETGVGTNVGLLLARENWVRSFVASATFYERFGPISGQLFDPDYHALLDSYPDGYEPGNPGLLAIFLAPADDSIEAEAIAATLGPAPVTIPTGAFYDIRALGAPALDVSGPWPVFDLSAPIVRAEPARAPALIIQGSPDQIGDELGTDELVAAYGATGGGEAELVVIEGASHLMRFDTVISDGSDSAFWAPVLDFIATH